jgi:hypothetical protein
MAEALGCDDSSIHMIPATGHGTYSFAFTVGQASPHALEHRDGQVEIDSVCIGIRDRRNHVIVTEAKRGPSTASPGTSSPTPSGQCAATSRTTSRSSPSTCA